MNKRGKLPTFVLLSVVFIGCAVGLFSIVEKTKSLLCDLDIQFSYTLVILFCFLEIILCVWFFTGETVEEEMRNERTD